MYYLVSSLIFLISLCFTFQALAYDTTRTFQASTIPHELKGITVDEKPGDFINLNLQFKDQQGKQVALKDYFKDGKPVLFTIIYYLCPNLCQLHLNGLMGAVSKLKIKNDFEFVALSMDHTESFHLAQKKKQSYINHLKLQQHNHIHFLTGIEKNIKKVASQVGFNFKWNEQQKQYAHLPVAYILTPQGQISKYLYGVEIDEKTIRLALTEASNGRVGGIMERILLFCFQFDPRKNKYTLYAYNLMRAGGVFMMILLALILIPVWFRKWE